MTTQTIRPVLAGVAELAGLLGVRRTTISQWHSRQNQNDFPSPIAELAMGPVWDQDQVVNWYRDYTPLRNMHKVGHLPEDYQVAQSVEPEDELMPDAQAVSDGAYGFGDGTW
jgi:transcriptional regulator with XRE-family HTH domain